MAFFSSLRAFITWLQDNCVATLPHSRTDIISYLSSPNDPIGDLVFINKNQIPAQNRCGNDRLRGTVTKLRT